MLGRVQGLARHLSSATASTATTTTSTTTSIRTMSSDQAPRWKKVAQAGIAKAFKDEKGEKSSALYQVLATVDPGPPPTPHARYVVHRGFVNEQRSKERESGVEEYDKDFAGSGSLILTTTDIRAPKSQEMIATAKQTGAGALGEICWWLESSQIQLRLNGQYHLLPTPSHEHFKNFHGDRLAPPSLKGGDGKFDWAQERYRIFEKLSPSLLASFARPMPGSKHPNSDQLKGGEDGPGEGGEGKDDKNSPWPLELPAPGKEENEEQKKLLQESEKNFALVVFEPHTVDLVDLARDQRSVFERQGDSPNAQWTEQRVVP